MINRTCSYDFNFNSVDLGLSGGNRVIFELSNALVDLGFKVSINFCGGSLPLWFSPVKADVLWHDASLFTRRLIRLGIINRDLMLYRGDLLQKYMPVCSVNVAGFWVTAKAVADSKMGWGVYLVQHYEPSFYMVDNVYFGLATESYRYPLKHVCVSSWLSEKVGGVCIGNGVNLDRFKRDNRSKIKQSVMFSFRSMTYKNSKLALLVADRLKVLGWWVFISNEKLTDAELIEMYNRSEVYVNLSGKEGFGLGMLEAWACGCAVVSTPCAEYLKPDNCVLVPFYASVEAVCVAVTELSDCAKLSRFSEAGGLTVQEYDFKYVVKKFLEAIK
jgi:hypothetical protein